MSFEEPEGKYFRGLDLTSLEIDQAYVNVTSQDPNLFVYLLSQDCVRCPLKLYPIQEWNSSGNSIVLSTHHPWTIRIRNSNSSELVSINQDDSNFVCQSSNVRLGQFGVYDLVVPDASGTGSSLPECDFRTALDPVDANIAILYCALILVAIGIVYQVFDFLNRKRMFNPIRRKFWRIKKRIGYKVPEDSSLEIDEDEAKNRPSGGKQRLRSLDTFRGITIALMIFVNDGAGGYWFMEHATWNGLQVADLAFPWFMWIMGFCIPMSVRSLRRNNTPTGVALIGILKRSAVLFLLGLMWNTSGWIILEKMRVPGVLQRFSITYLIVASSAFLFSHGNEENNNEEKTWISTYFADILCIWQRWIVASVFLIAHCLIIFLLPVPGCPTGYLGPAGLADDNAHPGECIGGATGYIDRVILGTNHIYGNPTAKGTYGTGPFDPEGILGCLLSVVQVFIGYQGGQIILSFSGHGQRVLRLFIWAIVTSLIGLLLCGASQDDGWIPINKNIWSLSYVMVTSGLAFFLIAVVYFVVDVKQWWIGEPFLAAGMNSILLYLGHQTAYNMLPFNFSHGSMNTHWIRLIESIWGVSAWLIVAFVLYKKKVFVTV